VRSGVVAALERALAGRADVRVAVLFGSEARGTAGPGSDVDLAVLGAAHDALDPFALGAELALAIGREVDVVDLREASIPLTQEIVRDGIVVHEGVRGAGALWRSHTMATLETDGPWYARMRDAYLERLATEGPRRGEG
jgi:predicted nucleotidyltransferase